MGNPAIWPHSLQQLRQGIKLVAEEQMRMDTDNGVHIHNTIFLNNKVGNNAMFNHGKAGRGRDEYPISVLCSG